MSRLIYYRFTPVFLFDERKLTLVVYLRPTHDLVMCKMKETNENMQVMQRLNKNMRLYAYLFKEENNNAKQNMPMEQ